jgi:hypothetical protein
MSVTTAAGSFDFGADAFAPLVAQDFNLGGSMPNFIDPLVTTQPFSAISAFSMSQGPFTSSSFSLFPTSPAPTATTPSTWTNNSPPACTAFVDDFLLEVPLLKSYRAISNIADIIGLSEELFSPNYLHTLQPILGRPVPAHLQPTPAQQRIPHHPFIDLLPWPSVRTKMVVIFSMPDRQRPPAARGPLGVINMMHDMDDDTEGVRVAGEDELNPTSWEVGQWFFSRWLFALDSEIIRRSNELREIRGAAQLRIQPVE